MFDQPSLDALAESIRQFGLIQPIVVADLPLPDGTLELMAGERRLRAHIQLGLTEIKCIRMNQTDPWMKEMIQLEENLRRENLTTSEEVEAKLRIHELHQMKYGPADVGEKVIKEQGGWGTVQTADLLNESLGGIRQDLQLAKAIRDDPELAKFANSSGKRAAFKAIKVRQEHAMRAVLADVLSSELPPSGTEGIILGDALTVLATFPDDSFDFCVTDPPYEINFGRLQEQLPFDDTNKLNDLQLIFKELLRVLRIGAHCYVFGAAARQTEMRLMLEGAGLWVCPVPLIWVKDNSYNLRPYYWRGINYEVIWYCAKGYPNSLTRIQQSSTYHFPTPTTRVHPTEKPIELVKQLIEECSQLKERGIDPFLGGGTFTLACKELDRIGVGIEIEKSWWFEAMQRLEG
jgi:DNA modification methylase